MRGTGRLIAVVGPSGAGKDTLIAALVGAEPSLHPVRRVITRPETAGGEDYDGVSVDEFAARRAAGAFAIWWQAHGLFYGIPADVADRIEQGHSAIANFSRSALIEAKRIFPSMITLYVTSPPEILAGRLAARGRETKKEIDERLERATYPLPVGVEAIEIANDGPPEATVARALAALYPERAMR